jgi:hypothetical protein
MSASSRRIVLYNNILKTCFNRVYNFQKTLCKDPEFIGVWFWLVENIQAKYNIQDYDFYNFNKMLK